MKIVSIVAVYDFSSGNITANGDGIDMQIKLEPKQLARLQKLAIEFFIESQKAVLDKVSLIPTSNLLEAPKVEPEYTEFTPVTGFDDDVPF